jgi:hypothetical protein
VFGIFSYAIDRGYPLALAQTMAMNTLVVLEIFHLFFIRNIHGTSLTWAPPGDEGRLDRGHRHHGGAVRRHLPAAAPGNARHQPVPLADGLLIVAIGAAFFAIIEIEKQIRAFRGVLERKQDQVGAALQQGVDLDRRMRRDGDLAGEPMTVQRGDQCQAVIVMGHAAGMTRDRRDRPSRPVERQGGDELRIRRIAIDGLVALRRQARTASGSKSTPSTVSPRSRRRSRDRAAEAAEPEDTTSTRRRRLGLHLAGGGRLAPGMARSKRRSGRSSQPASWCE